MERWVLLQGILPEDSSSLSCKSFVYCFVTSLSSKYTKISDPFPSLQAEKTHRYSAIQADLGTEAELLFKGYIRER